jgi:hypothetical protein
MLGAVRSARHRHGLPARKASEAGFAGSDISVVLPAYVDAGLTTSAFGGRGVAAEVAAGVDLAARSGVGLLDPCLRPVRDRDDLGHHTAKASTAWAGPHVLRLRAIGSAGQVASVAGTARVLLFAATAGDAGVPDSRLIAPAAPDGLQGHGAVCGRGRPGVQHWGPLMPTGCRYPPLVATGDGGGSTVEDPEGFKNRRETRRGTHWASVSTVIAAVVGGLGGAYLGVMIGADRDDARADRKFAREQRIEVYGDFLGSTDKAMKSIEPFPPGPPEGEDALATKLTPPTTEQLNEMNESVTSVETLAGRISVIGGAEATAMAAALMKDVQQGQKVASIIYDCHNEYASVPRCFKPIRTYFPLPETQEYTFAVDELFPDHRQAFLEQVREDLALPD